MILVTGGAFQGKGKFAQDLARQKQKGELLQTIVVLEAADLPREFEELQYCQHSHVIIGLHRWVRILLESGKDPCAMVRRLLDANPDAVLTLDQVGCGVVPLDAFDRQYREVVGSVGCEIARQAAEVYLLNCGIARRIK
ncbi:bifunctional adenosylcobinamide kinase/adenosylcobinamide-phosphate guanylyltransferase [Lachnospiraceae bacterium 45-W7]